MAVPASVLVLVATSFVVPLLFLAWLRRREHEGRERFLMVALAFLSGAVLAVAAAIVLTVVALSFLPVGLPLIVPGLGAEAFLAVAVAPLLEEPAKGLWLGLFRRRFVEREDGLVYGAAIGLGFGATENVFYVLEAVRPDGLELAWLTLGFRTAGTVLLHGAATALVGYGLTRTGRQGGVAWWRALPWLLLAVALHAVFNFLAVQPAFGFRVVGTAVGAVAFFAVATAIARMDARGRFA